MSGLKLNQLGETIVEVLMSVVVIGSVIGGAYAIVGRSNNTIQADKERYQAQLLANNQADMLKAKAADNKPIIASFGVQSFCIDSNGVAALDQSVGGSNPCDDASATGGGLTYHTSILPAKNSVGSIITDMFVITVTWGSLINKGQDNVRLVYGI